MKELTELLAQLATKLGTTADHLWGVLIIQAKVSIVYNSIELLICIIYLSLCYPLILKKMLVKHSMAKEQDKGKYNYEGGWAIGTIPLFAVVVVAFLFSLYLIERIVTAAINPEYWALQTVLETIKH